jgi:pimeloyl-ACP methyl ester carboxylesterase
MTLFALIHGGAHGGWCWERVVPELEARGHTAVAPDLPFDDESAGATEWARTVVDAIESAGGRDTDDAVVVGHSLGGMCVPVVASMRPVRRMVFLGAMVPVPGRVYAEYLAENADALAFDASVGGTPGPSGLSWEAARHGFYQDLDEATARRAFERLRPLSLTVFTETCPIDRWPDVPSTYILMTEDRAVGQDWSRRVAREGIDADLIELAGGHSPFYSRPAELADVLAKL